MSSNSDASDEDNDFYDQSSATVFKAPISKIVQNQPKMKVVIKPKPGTKGIVGKPVPKSQPTVESPEFPDKTLTMETGLSLHNVSVGEDDANQGPPSGLSAQLNKLKIDENNGSSPELPKKDFKNDLKLREKPAIDKNSTTHLPTVAFMLISALQVSEDDKGTSIMAIKKHIKTTHSRINMKLVDPPLRLVIRRGIDSGLLGRPPSFAEEKKYSMTGRLLLVNQNQAMIDAFCEQDLSESSESDEEDHPSEALTNQLMQKTVAKNVKKDFVEVEEAPSMASSQNNPSKVNAKIPARDTKSKTTQQPERAVPTSTITGPYEEDIEDSSDSEMEPEPEKQPKEIAVKKSGKSTESAKNTDSENAIPLSKSVKNPPKETKAKKSTRQTKTKKTAEHADESDDAASRSTKDSKAASRSRAKKKETTDVKAKSSSRTRK